MISLRSEFFFRFMQRIRPPVLLSRLIDVSNKFTIKLRQLFSVIVGTHPNSPKSLEFFAPDPSIARDVLINADPLSIIHIDQPLLESHPAIIISTSIIFFEYTTCIAMLAAT